MPHQEGAAPRSANTRFDPLNPEEIGRVLQERLDAEPYHAFPPARFSGAGLYAIYATAPRGPYADLAGTNVPVYVGKAEAGNSSYGFSPDYEAPKLWSRIVKHSRSVEEVTGVGGHPLSAKDFRVRYLRLEDAWIVLGERALLRQYRPVLWNTLMNGFGSNPPGTARQNARSAWDTMHPGRPRAGQLPNRFFTLTELEELVRRGITISLMPDDERKLRALQDLRSTRPNKIWSPARSGDRDRRLVVHDAHRFLDEAERMGLAIGDTEYRLGDAPTDVLADDLSDTDLDMAG